MTEKLIFVVAIVAVLLLGIFLQKQYGLFAISGTETMTRTLPIQVEAGQTFIVTYTATATGIWGASIVDSVSGGCKFPDGTTQLKTVMLSPDGSTKTITMTTPSISGTCSFTGDYKFGEAIVKTFITQTVNIVICNIVDTNCDGKVDRTELGSYITKWQNNQATRDDLGKAIVAWMGS